MGVADRPLVVWLGRLASALVVMILLADAAVAIIKPETMRVEMETTGFPMNLSMPLDLVMLGCAVVYAIPRTATLGAILVTGFLGGAICTHFRLGLHALPAGRDWLFATTDLFRPRHSHMGRPMPARHAGSRAPTIARRGSRTPRR